MINPTKDDIGRKVIYEDRSGMIKEEGVITSVTDNWVFVRYGANGYSQAAARKDLEWTFPTSKDQ